MPAETVRLTWHCIAPNAHLSLPFCEIEYILQFCWPMRLMSASEWKWYDSGFSSYWMFAATTELQMVTNCVWCRLRIPGECEWFRCGLHWTVSNSSGTRFVAIAHVLGNVLPSNAVWSMGMQKMAQCKFGRQNIGIQDSPAHTEECECLLATKHETFNCSIFAWIIRGKCLKSVL